MIVLNARDVAVDLLEKRASIYSDRPRCEMARLCGTYTALCRQPCVLTGSCHNTGFGRGTGLMRYGPTHKMHRKLITQTLNTRVVQRDYVPLQERMARKLAILLLDRPDDFVHPLSRYDYSRP